MSTTEDKSAGPVVTQPIHDLYLRMLIRVLEQDGSNRSSMSITLTTNGGVVYGHLITRETWKGLWAEQMKTAVGTGVDVLATFPDDIDSGFDQAYEEEGVEPPEDDGMRYFVHLKNATILAPGANRISVPSWRGRMESVVGWSLGGPS